MQNAQETPTAKCLSIVHNVCGQVCPSTLLTTLREINRHRTELRAGQVQLLVKSDSREATATIPQAVSNMGYEVEVCKEQGYYLFRIKAPAQPLEEGP